MCILCLFYFSEENQCKNLFSSSKYRLQSVNNFAFCDCNLLTEKKLKKFMSELKQNYNLIYDPWMRHVMKIHGNGVFNDDKC